MTRVYYSLYDRLLPQESLTRAFRKVKANNGKPGVDGQTVEDFAQDLPGEIVMLVRELREKSYRPQPVKRVTIPKDGGGVRGLGIPTVRDRVVQQALLEILQPIFDPGFHPSSYGYRPGHSAHQEVAKAELFIRKYNLRHVVDMDLSRCFDTLSHELILGGIRKRVVDGSVLGLVRQFLQSGVMTGDGWMEMEEGSPQGGVISPLLANIYLDAFDQEMKNATKAAPETKAAWLLGGIRQDNYEFLAQFGKSFGKLRTQQRLSQGTGIVRSRPSTDGSNRLVTTRI